MSVLRISSIAVMAVILAQRRDGCAYSPDEVVAAAETVCRTKSTACLGSSVAQVLDRLDVRVTYTVHHATLYSRGGSFLVRVRRDASSGAPRSTPRASRDVSDVSIS